MRIVQASGFRKATMQEIAREAGVSLGALQHHYWSKEVLVEAVIEYVFKESEADGDVWPDASQPLRQRTDDFLDRAWRYIYGKPAYLASWHLHFACQASPRLSSRINAKREPWSDGLTRLFLDRFPEIRENSPDPEGFARLAFTSLRGIAVLALFGDTLADNQDQLNALSETILRAARPCTPARHGSRRKTSRPLRT